VLEVLPPALLPAVAALVQAARLPREHKAAVLEWLLRQGTPAAKLAAAKGLSLLDEARAKDVVRENLAAADPAVQAWATLHLRHCGVPKAHLLLVERLESPHAEVRAAARRELSGFNASHVLSRAEDWSLDEARRVGRLLLKVDPDAPARLQRELLHPAKQKRIRAARGVLRLGLQEVALDALIALSQDSDPLVRRTAAEALAEVDDSAAAEKLEELLDDENPGVRAAAAESLRRKSQSASVRPSVGA
jgi:HEAT repeat protein